MKYEAWLRNQTTLPDRETISSLYLAGLHWQLYTTGSGGYGLAADAELYQDWIRRQMLEEGLMMPLEGTDGQTIYFLTAPAGEMISSVEYGPFTQNSRQALDFARAVRSSRARNGLLTKDSLYISGFSILLPCSPAAQRRYGSMGEDVDLFLGSWICHGMNVFLTDTERIHKYASWLSDETRKQILSLFDLKEKKPGEGETVLSMPRPFSSDPSSAEKPFSASTVRKNRQEGPFSLPGRPALEKFFREEILDVIDREEEYQRFGVGFPGATLLYGPSGSGKTFAVEKLADYLGWPVFQVTSGTVGSKYIHETSQKISKTFDAAICNAPSVLIIDEMEAFLSSRNSENNAYITHMEEVAEFLRRIPDAAKNRVLLFGMTNLPETIDKAILRKGRFDHILEVRMPSRAEVLEVLTDLLDKLPVEENLRLDRIAARLEGCPLSDVSFVVNEAGRISVHAHKKRIDMESLETACSALKPAVKKKQVGFQL